jgi:hypothetical protein
MLGRQEPLDETFLVKVVAARELAVDELVLLLLERFPADTAITVDIFALHHTARGWICSHFC